MNCQLCQEKFEEYHEGRLPSGTKTQVDAHLGICRKCAESYRLFTLAERVISSEKSVMSNPFLTTRIMTGIEKSDVPVHETETSFRRILKPVLVTIALAAAIIYGIMAGNIYQPERSRNTIPVELALINDAAIESVGILTNE